MTQIMMAENVHLYYGKKEALHGFDIGFDENQITALIGPSGCGKSTFLRCLNRMNDLIENVTITGSFKLQGEDIYSPRMDVVKLRKEVGMVFQQPNPFPLSVYDNIAFGLKLKGMLAFSGGQQQRICIARVLAVQPKVILMDEPTSALDPVSNAKIEDTLVELKKDYTIIIVTHNMQQASRISDNTAFFLNGDLIESGKTKKLFLTPKEKLTDDYLNGRFG